MQLPVPPSQVARKIRHLISEERKPLSRPSKKSINLGPAGSSCNPPLSFQTSSNADASPSSLLHSPPSPSLQHPAPHSHWASAMVPRARSASPVPAGHYTLTVAARSAQFWTRHALSALSLVSPVSPVPPPQRCSVSCLLRSAAAATSTSRCSRGSRVGSAAARRCALLASRRAGGGR